LELAMTQSVSKDASEPHNNDEASPRSLTTKLVDASGTPLDLINAAFTDTGAVTVAALLHLIRLMGGDLILSQTGCDTERFEKAVRTKIENFTSPTANKQAREAGLVIARHLVELVLTQLRAQAELKGSLSCVGRGETQSNGAAASAGASRFLN
jgi:hypothetical protein